MPSQATDSRRDQPVLVVDQVTARETTKGRSRRTAAAKVDNISFVMSEGEAVGILGTQADGTDVLLGIAAGLIEPDRGDVYVRSQPAQLTSQTVFALDETLRTNIERVAMALELNGARLRTAVKSILLNLELEDQADVACADLEPIDVERARLAAILHAKPNLVLISEPQVRGRALLNEEGRGAVERYLQAGGALMVVGRDPEIMRRICGRIIWVKDGRILMDSTTAAVTRNFGRLTAASDDHRKAAQLYRRLSNEYVGLTIVTNEPGRRKDRS